MSLNSTSLDLLANTIRVLSASAVEKANSGHPGMPMGAADYASVLWSEFLLCNPEDPQWPGRDRFVLSAGHGSMLLYSLLHLFGYKVSLEDLKQFRQWDSITPGHPEFGLTPGVETTTGPLGQGFGNGVGMALSQRMLAARFGESLFSSFVYGIVSDGDLMEGVASEAASLAGHWELGNLIYLYDDNHISIGGRTDICFNESVPKRFEAYGWHVLSIDGHDKQATYDAIVEAKKVTDKPSIICAKTIIGKGSPGKADTSGVHGAPLGDEELEKTLQALSWKGDDGFQVPEEVQTFCTASLAKKKEAYDAWQQVYTALEPAEAREIEKYFKREVPESLKASLLEAFSNPVKAATRNLSGDAIQVIAAEVPSFIGGSADLEPSTKTLIKDADDVQSDSLQGRNLRFGVREHGMGAIQNGFAYTQSWIPFSSTFLVFSDYMRPSIRLAALSHLQTIYVFTHDSFWVGEDGPTHQPIEHLQSLRLIPNLHVFRPADGMEVAQSYWSALQRKNGPAAILCTRQGLAPLERPEGFDPDMILKGAYRLQGDEDADLVILASGSEVALAQHVARDLSDKRIAVVSVPCLELFEQQPELYRQSVIPAAAKKVVVEAGSTYGWERYVGNDALLIGRDTYGASAPGEVLAERFGLSPDTVRTQILDWL